MADVKELTTQNFDKEILGAGGEGILVDFWATWCGPCRMQGPAVEKLAVAGYNVGKVNIDEQPELAEKFQVMSIPTLIVFKDGKIKEKMVGLQSIQTLEKALKA